MVVCERMPTRQLFVLKLDQRFHFKQEDAVKLFERQYPQSGNQDVIEVQKLYAGALLLAVLVDAHLTYIFDF